MTKIMRQFHRAGAWKAARDLLHVLVNYDIPTFRVDDHSVFVESPRVDLRADMLIFALVMIHFNAIIFLHERLFISILPELWVKLCRWTFRHLVVGCGIKLGARFQSPVVSNPLSHGSTAGGSHTTAAQSQLVEGAIMMKGRSRQQYGRHYHSEIETTGRYNKRSNLQEGQSTTRSTGAEKWPGERGVRKRGREKKSREGGRQGEGTPLNQSAARGVRALTPTAKGKKRLEPSCSGHILGLQ